MNQLYEKGSYVGKIIEQALGKASTGTPQFMLRFEVEGAVNPQDPQGELLPCDRGEAAVYLYINDKTIDFVREDIAQLCEYTGVAFESFERLDPSHTHCTSFVGTRCQFYCKHENYQGNWKERWSIDRGGSGAAPLDDKEKRGLDAQFGKYMRDLPKPVVKVADPAESQEAQTVPEFGADDDDTSIPF